MDYREEANRQFKVIDQMITSHCVLKERFEKKARSLDIAILLISALLVATVFLDSKIILFLNANENLTRFIIGILSIFVLGLTIIQFKVDWKQCSEQHQKAYEVLCIYKPIFRSMRKDKNLKKEDYEKKAEEFKIAISFICSIPEKQFVALKSKHLKKVLLSKIISRNPSTSVFIIKAYLFFKGNTKKIKNV